VRGYGRTRSVCAAPAAHGDAPPERTPDGSAADDAARVGEHHHAQQHGRRIGGCRSRVIPIPGIEWRQVDRLLEQMVQRVIERAREELDGEVDRDDLGLRVDRLVSSHDRSRRGTTETADFCRRSRIGAQRVP
jgi:hypothetical protein